MDATDSDPPEEQDESGPGEGTPPTIEANTHVFIIKLWLEERDPLGTWAIWRGHITHVPSGGRRYFDDLALLETIIAPYLEALGIRHTPDHTSRFIRECLRRLWGGR
jgi:hypothetical protein